MASPGGSRKKSALWSSSVLGPPSPLGRPQKTCFWSLSRSRAEKQGFWLPQGKPGLRTASVSHGLAREQLTFPSAPYKNHNRLRSDSRLPECRGMLLPDRFLRQLRAVLQKAGLGCCHSRRQAQGSPCPSSPQGHVEDPCRASLKSATTSRAATSSKPALSEESDLGQPPHCTPTKTWDQEG